MKRTRILLADDHAVLRSGIRMLVESEWGWEVCGEASTGREAVSMSLKLKPDVIVLDIGMPELNGLDATRQIKRDRPETAVLIFSSHESEQLVRDVFDAGARGYLLKNDAPQHLVAAVKTLLTGKPYFSARISETIFAAYLKAGQPGAAPAESAHRLSPREREIVQLLCEGSTNKEVAAQLGVSAATIETHRKNIMQKLDLKAFSQLVVYAIRNQIIEG